jgi:hypothetical protein
MEIAIFWVLLCFVPAIIANSKGRSGTGFFFLSVLLSPIIGLVVAIVAKKNVKSAETAQIISKEAKKCPHCAEMIKYEAKVCRYCGKDPAATS